MKDQKFNLYKGLQKPLVFKGFQGRYIFWGIGALAGAVIVAAIACISLGPLPGMGILVVYLGVAFLVIFKKQEKGLYSKTKNTHTLFVRKNNLK